MFWIGSLLAWGGAALSNISWNYFYAAPAGLMAGAVWITASRTGSPVWKARWNAALMAWLLFGAFTWLGAGYFQNQRVVFLTGLLATLGALALVPIVVFLGRVFGAGNKYVDLASGRIARRRFGAGG